MERPADLDELAEGAAKPLVIPDDESKVRILRQLGEGAVNKREGEEYL